MRPIPRRTLMRAGSPLFLGAILVAACGGEGASSPSPGDAAPAAGATTAARTGSSDDAIAAVHAALAGTQTIDGEAFDHSVIGDGPAMAWFWAPWCTICRAEAPDIADVAARYDGRVMLFGVAGRGETDAMREFVADTGTGGFEHVADVDGSVWQSFGVFAQPAYAFISSDGETEVFVGGLGGDALADRIDSLLAS